MDDGLLPLTLELKPWFQDHRVGGRSVLPAVETMLVLARVASERYPGLELRVMEEIRFPGFLELPAGATSQAAFAECQREEDGRLRLKLFSRVRLKAMSRLKEHGELVFCPKPISPSVDLPPAEPADRPGQVTEIAADRIYRDLVPFGPSYRTLQDRLVIAGSLAWGWLKAPALPATPMQQVLGSPFPLDGALHAACVLGQQLVDYVPFPVALARRVVVRPTVPDGWYRTKVHLVDVSDEELRFDLVIVDDRGRLCEEVSGVRMRDVGGRRR